MRANWSIRTKFILSYTVIFIVAAGIMMYLMLVYAKGKNIIVTEVPETSVSVSQPEAEEPPVSYRWDLEMQGSDGDTIDILCPDNVNPEQVNVSGRYDVGRIQVQVKGQSAEAFRNNQPTGNFELISSGYGCAEDNSAVFSFDTTGVCECVAEIEGNVIKLHINAYSKDNRPVVVMDPGHGGSSTGTRAGKLCEKDITLSVCKSVERMAGDRPYRVMLTRSADETITAVERLFVCELLQADAYIGIHLAQNIDKPDEYGMQGSYNSLYFGRKISNAEFAAEVLENSCMATNNRANGLVTVTEEDALLEALSIPSTVLYAGYMTNAEELKLLGNAEYIDMIATGIINALDEIYEAGTFAE